ncbi:MAG: hypothetical protein DCF15_17035, partial [Phormidesmis priestleyi]
MIRRLLNLSGIVLLAVGAIVLLSPINDRWLQWYLAFNNQLLGLVVDLARVSLIALLVAGLLSPFEALGWWAGWYGDGIETHIACKISDQLSTHSDRSDSRGDSRDGDRSDHSNTTPSRYLIYLDGISQSCADYPVRVQNFLDELIAALPPDVVLIQDILAYSALNRPLTAQRPFSTVWRWINRVEAWNEQSPLDIFI